MLLSCENLITPVLVIWTLNWEFHALTQILILYFHLHLMYGGLTKIKAVKHV